MNLNGWRDINSWGVMANPTSGPINLYIDGPTPPSEVEIGTLLELPPVVAFDFFGADITGDIVTEGSYDGAVAGSYSVKYSVYDSAGAYEELFIDVAVVVPSQPPTITIVGDPLPSTILANTGHVVPSVAASGQFGEDLTDQVTYVDNIDDAVIGTYTIVYSVTDSYGNVGTLTLTTEIVLNVTGAGRINGLILNPDNVEIMRDNVVAILVNETATQQEIATQTGLDPAPWAFRVFRERSNPFDMFKDPDGDPTPIVNVSWDSSSLSAGDRIKNSVFEVQIHLDVIAFAISQDDGGTGHIPGDEQAALNRDRIVRLVRNIISAAEYIYLDMRGVVTERKITSITNYQGDGNDRSGAFTLASRITLSVKLQETSPQIDGEPLNVVSIDFKRASDGQILAAARYDYT